MSLNLNHHENFTYHLIPYYQIELIMLIKMISNRNLLIIKPLIIYFNYPNEIFSHLTLIYQPIVEDKQNLISSLDNHNRKLKSTYLAKHQTS